MAKRKKKGGYVVFPSRRAFLALLFAAAGITLASVGFGVSRSITLGELKARISLLEALLKDPITESDLAALEARLAKIAEPDSPRLVQFLASLEAKEKLLPYPLVFNVQQLAAVPSKTVAVVGRVSNLRKSGNHLFFHLNDVPIVFFNYPHEVNAQLSNGAFAAVVGTADEYQGTPQVKVSSTANIIPAR